MTSDALANNKKKNDYNGITFFRQRQKQTVVLWYESGLGFKDTLFC